MSDKKSPLEQALDLLVYAPVGFALSVRDLVPQLAERGRQQLTGQVAIAKVVGEYAVQFGQQEADKALQRARQQAEGALASLWPGGEGPAPPRGIEEAVEPGEVAVEGEELEEHLEGEELETDVEAVSFSGDVQTSAPATSAPVTAPGGPDIQVHHEVAEGLPAAGPVPDVDSLGIPGYDTLSASQVVQRLAGLSKEELEAVRAYEAGRRCRKTILNRVAQLQGSNGAG